MKRLTVITPTLNSELYIEDCIRSVVDISNELRNIKHIIVDSYSNDKTLEIVKKYHLKTIFCPPGNIYNAINLGIRSTKDEWITYINSDDLLNINLIKEFNNLDNSIDILSGSINIINLKNSTNYICKCLPRKLFFASYIVGGMPFPQSGTIFSRKIYEKLNGFDTSYKYAADYDFFSRAYLNKATYKISKFKLAEIRIHNNQLSQRFKIVHNKEIDHISKKLFKDRTYLYINKFLYKIFAHLNRSPTKRFYNLFHNYVKIIFKQFVKNQ